MGCGAAFAVRDSIPIFASGDPFYDTYVEEHVPFAAGPPAWKAAVLRVLPYWSWREWRFFRSHLEPGQVVLDVGCGRGKAWFTGDGRFVAGVDPCWPVLQECAAHYDLVAQASIAALPFPERERRLRAHKPRARSRAVRREGRGACRGGSCASTGRGIRRCGRDG